MWAIWACPKSWAHLGTLPFPNPGGFKRRPKDIYHLIHYVGLHTNYMAHPGQNWTCAPFAPTMSVRNFGRFLPFSILLPRRELCSAPPCKPDTWTKVPNMVCSLCILVLMTHTPRGGTDAHSQKELCQGVCGQFYHFGTCGYNSAYHHAMVHADLWESSECGPTLNYHWVPHRALSPVYKPSWRNTLGDTFNFVSLFRMPKHPFLGPQFQPTVWSNGSSISLCS